VVLQGKELAVVLDGREIDSEEVREPNVRVKSTDHLAVVLRIYQEDYIKTFIEPREVNRFSRPVVKNRVTCPMREPGV
jgi:hypothetical protein